MPRARQPTRYLLTARCTAGCTLNPRNLRGQGELVHSLFEAGDNDVEISKKVDSLGVGLHVSFGAVARHRSRHLEPMVGDPSPAPGAALPKKLSDLELLNAIIERGAENMQSTATKVGPDLALKAIEMKQRLTQGNVFDSFLASMEEAMQREYGPENPAAVAGDEEQEQGDAGTGD